MKYESKLCRVDRRGIQQPKKSLIQQNLLKIKKNNHPITKPQYPKIKNPLNKKKKLMFHV